MNLQKLKFLDATIPDILLVGIYKAANQTPFIVLGADWLNPKEWK